MILIHVSGTPGSGKTTLGQKFAALEGVIVIDTDDVINAEDQEELMKLDKKGPPGDIHKLYREEWERRLTRTLWKEYHDAIEKNAKMLLFTGIMNGDPEPGRILPMPFANIEKYFLDLPLPFLLKQYYGRYGKEMSTEDEFWEGVAAKRYKIPSSHTYLNAFKQEKGWHLSHGYIPMDPTAVEQRIRQALGIHQVKQNMGWVGRPIQ